MAPTYHMLTHDEKEEKSRLEDLGEAKRDRKAREAKRDHLNWLLEMQVMSPCSHSLSVLRTEQRESRSGKSPGSGLLWPKSDSPRLLNKNP